MPQAFGILAEARVGKKVDDDFLPSTIPLFAKPSLYQFADQRTSTTKRKEMNTTQGQELYVKYNVDHAAELALSLRRGGTSIEIFSA